jgi:hypothetical protein
MAELVRDHASEEQHDEDHAVERRRLPAEPPVRAGDPDEKKQKGDVNAHHRAGDHGDGNGPEHRELRGGWSNQMVGSIAAIPSFRLVSSCRPL